MAALLAYLGSPYFSLWKFAQALETNDVMSLEARVDFVSVRASLKQQLRAKLPPAPLDAKQDLFSGMVARMAPSLIDQLVDSLVTPQNLAALLANPEVVSDASQAATGTRSPATSRVDVKLDFSRVRYAFFTGLREFLVDFDGIKLRFRFAQLSWSLREVEVPLENVKL